MRFIALQGWEKFQHYKDRDPPWVKLYRDLLTAESWVLGTDISRLVQVASILLAARYTNKIPFRWPLLRKVASLNCTEKQFNEAIVHLTTTSFLEVQEVTEPASTALATCATTSNGVYSEAEQSRAEAEQRQSAGAPLLLHESLPTDEWEQWLAHRKRKRWPCDSVTLGKQLSELASQDTEAQRVMLNRSINAGWQGIFPPRGAPPKKRWLPSDDEAAA